MKIEICEQMVQSWLLNCKLCEVVQTNWKKSPLYNVSDPQYVDVLNFVTQIETEINAALCNEETLEKLGRGEEAITVKIMPAGRASQSAINKTKQFIKQCEIDVVGIKLDNGVATQIYMVDSAFHSGRLGYKDVVGKVTQKIVRAVAVSGVVFGCNVPVDVVFVSPKCGCADREAIEEIVKILRPLVQKWNPKASITLYFDEDFATNIYLPLKQNIGVLNDDNDLFMRAMNLAKVAEENLPKAKTKTRSTKTTTAAATTSPDAPQIVLTPSDPELFKQQLILKKRAEITWVYDDGTQEDRTWDASKFQPTSSVTGNLQSRPQWRNKETNGLVEVQVKII